MAQTQGDIAFVGISTSNRAFNVVALNQISAHQTIFFSDAVWQKNSFTAKEGSLHWQTGERPIPAGEVIRFTKVDGELASVSHGSVIDGTLRLSNLRNVLFAYFGSSEEAPDIFLTSITKDKEHYDGTLGSLQGTNLELGKEAILLKHESMEAVYEGPRRDKRREEFLYLIGDPQNTWRPLSEDRSKISAFQSRFTIQQASGGDQSVETIKIADREGWRGISSSSEEISFKDWLGDFWMQGLIGSDDPEAEPTIFAWNEKDGGYLFHPRDMREVTEPGKGYFIYFMEDDNPTEEGIQRGFPKIITRPAENKREVIEVPVTATDANDNGRIDGREGFNLLGNPFDKNLSVAALKRVLRQVNSSTDNYLYRWNAELGNGNGGIEPLNDGDVIAPFEAFWVRYLEPNVNGLVRINANSMSEDTEGERYSTAGKLNRSFKLMLGDDVWFDTYTLEANKEGSIGEDPLDAYKLFSLNAESINLFSHTSNQRYARNVLPRDLDERLEVPLSFSAPNRDELTFRWDQPQNLPEDWELILADRQMNREINLETSDTYSFSLESDGSESGIVSQNKPLLNAAEDGSISTGRFSLIVQPRESLVSHNEDGSSPESISLKANYPNPFTSTTTIPFELVEETEVKLTIWNMIGQKVATLVDGVREAGEHDDVRWNASNMPSGMYIARLEAEDEVFTRKMTLIK